MKKTIYSLSPLLETLLAANHRYLKCVSQIETPEVGLEKLHRLAETKENNPHRHKGFNLFAEEDASLYRTLLRNEFFIRGFTNKDLESIHKMAWRTKMGTSELDQGQPVLFFFTPAHPNAAPLSQPN